MRKCKYSFISDEAEDAYKRGCKLGSRGTRYEAIGPHFCEYMGWLEAMIEAGRLERCGPFARVER